MSQKRQKKLVNVPQSASCAGSCTPAKCWYDATKQEGGTFTVFDPVQGPVPDCHLIAALASMAWVKEGDLSRYGAAGTYAFKSGNQTITKEILYNNGTPSGAQFGPNNVMWPLWYEKAFAKLKGCANWVDPKTKVVCPNVCNIPAGAGMDSLIEIAVNYNNNNKLNLITLKYTKAADIATMKAALDNSVTSRAALPAVAWAASATTELKSGHTYSYLGYIYKNPDYYIILRDPCKTEPPASAKLLTTGKWPNSATGPINFATLNDGIFALKFQAITNGLTIGYVY